MKSMYINPKLYNKVYCYMTFENVIALRVSLETGMRIDDVLRLRASNLNGRKITFIAQKTGKQGKKVISQNLCSMLKTLLRTDKDNEYFFKHRIDKGKHRTRQAVWKNLKSACKAVGIDCNFTPHSARKTYSVEYFRDNGLPATQEALQHDNANTTMIYAFSDLLVADEPQKPQLDIDKLATAVADKVIEKINNL